MKVTSPRVLMGSATTAARASIRSPARMVTVTEVPLSCTAATGALRRTSAPDSRIRPS
ncbi:Uncharacterised protein [Mycobacteroides abscessus subsp. abscessus]|nr:Uncharacterised protein [Mycobacteroides abscessus subsp. abscessus]